MDSFFATFLSALALAAPPPEPFGIEWPASGQVTDGFGPRWGRLHTGIDIGILSKLGVVAAANGKVKAAGYLPGYSGYGLVVLLGHGEGRETLYAHLSRIDVREGEWLKAGEPIGLAGCTGSCTGTHLHFELREGGRPIDPSSFLR
jgi:murein DD-endopeptidase MepM/ murein hydrolase activator NlpD